jgi:hypothetical protein
MPTSIPSSFRAHRHSDTRDRSGDLLACTAFAVVGLLLVAVTLHFEINGAKHGVSSVAAATESAGTFELGVP